MIHKDMQEGKAVAALKGKSYRTGTRVQAKASSPIVHPWEGDRLGRVS